MHRAIVSAEITDETLDDLRCESATLEEVANIEEVARMLAIHRGDELAAVKF